MGGEWVTVDFRGVIEGDFQSGGCNTQVSAYAYDSNSGQYVAGPIANVPNCTIPRRTFLIASQSTLLKKQAFAYGTMSNRQLYNK